MCPYLTLFRSRLSFHFWRRRASTSYAQWLAGTGTFIRGAARVGSAGASGWGTAAVAGFTDLLPQSGGTLMDGRSLAFVGTNWVVFDCVPSLLRR